MAEIVLGIGTSHTPMLNAAPTDWPRFLELDAVRPHLDKEGSATTYAALLAAAGPEIARHLTPERMAASHAEAQAAILRLANLLREARLDALIVVGDDQRELFFDANLPSVLVYRGASIRNAPRPPRGGSEWMRHASARYYEATAARDYPVDAALAHHLIVALVEREFDVATADSLPEGASEGHAFGFIHKRLMDGFVLPIVPVFLNTYYPPNQPTPRRCYRLGQALRQAVESFPGDARIGIAASGGLSHFTVDETLDGAVIQALREKDGAALAALPRAKLNSGSSEIRNWICAAGAVEYLALDWVTYRPGYRTPAGTGTGLCFAAWRKTGD
jgi:3-O-methylgallate 3,4-dioxygenase